MPKLKRTKWMIKNLNFTAFFRSSSSKRLLSMLVVVLKLERELTNKMVMIRLKRIKNPIVYNAGCFTIEYCPEVVDFV